MIEQYNQMKLRVFIKKVIEGLYYIYGETDLSFDEVEGLIERDDGRLYLTFWKHKDNYTIMTQFKVPYEFDKSKEWRVYLVKCAKDVFTGIIIDSELEDKFTEKAEIKFEDLKPFKVRKIG